MPNDDECVLLYLEIAEQLKTKSKQEIVHLLKTIEQHYDSEADNDLGDFINNVACTILYHLNDDELHSYIRDDIYDSELDYNLIFCIGSTILSKAYTGHIMV